MAMSRPLYRSPLLRRSGAVENANGFVQLDHRPNFSRGDKVSVLAGAFQDRFGLYEGMSGRDRVMVLLDLLGRKVRVVLDAEFIEAA